jgi:glycosyltransferase involved in cell wall biosynthesis
MISDVYFPRVNGVSTSIQTLRRALAARGHASTLIAPDYPGATPEDGIVRVPGWQVPRDPEDRLMHLRQLARALDALDARAFDVVHIHTPFLAHRAGVKWARKHGLPCVETYHTLFEEYFHHYFPFVPRAWLAALARMISRKECGGVTAVIAPSTPMRDTLIAYGVNRPIHVIPTGLPESAFELADGAAFRIAHGIPPERPVMLFVGRVAFEKNLHLLLDMLDRLRADVPEALLLIAGEGPALGRLKRDAARMGLNDNVRFVGYLDRHTELPACYCAANVFVFASRTETQGLVLIESMALGVPVVALAAMGTKDVLKEGEGCRIAPDDAAGFAALVAPLLRDPDSARALGDKGRDYARSWGDAAMGERIAALYRQLAPA